MGVYYGIQRSSDYLAHYGVKGMRWGVRKEYKKHPRITRPANTKLLKGYSGPIFFISQDPTLKKLKPRVPSNFLTKYGYEDAVTPRICFAPSIDKCLAGMSSNLDGKTFSVYKPKNTSRHNIFKPNKKAVPDSSITDEMWICEPCSLKKVGTIKITGNRGESGKQYKYGKNTATLYDDWTYDFVKKGGRHG